MTNTYTQELRQELLAAGGPIMTRIAVLADASATDAEILCGKFKRRGDPKLAARAEQVRNAMRARYETALRHPEELRETYMSAARLGADDILPLLKDMGDRLSPETRDILFSVASRSVPNTFTQPEPAVLQQMPVTEPARTARLRRRNTTMPKIPRALHRKPRI